MITHSITLKERCLKTKLSEVTNIDRNHHLWHSVSLQFDSVKCYWENRKNWYLLGVKSGRRGGLMVSALASGFSGPGSSPARGHCVVFLDRTLYFHSASLHPGVYLMLWVALRWTSIPSKGGVELLLVTSCWGNRDKLRPDEPLGSCAVSG